MPENFLRWLSCEESVSFPWSMIDKITPHPSQKVADQLTALGVAGMAITKSATGTVSAPSSMPR